MEVNRVIQGDCLIELPKIESGSVDTVGTIYGDSTINYIFSVPPDPSFELIQELSSPDSVLIMVTLYPECPGTWIRVVTDSTDKLIQIVED